MSSWDAGSAGVDPERVAELIVTPVQQGRGRRGSGYRVSTSAVLTAAHVVRDAALVRVRFNADQPNEWMTEGTVAWADPTVDAAVVAITPRPQDEGQVAPVGLGRVAERDMTLACSAVGFPRFKLRDDPTQPLDDGSPSQYRDSAHLVGTIAVLANRRQGALEVTVPPPERDPDPERSPWEGMSGAAVFSGGRIIGLVAEHYRSDGPGRLTATRVDRWHKRLSAAQLEELCAISGLSAQRSELTDIGPAIGHDGQDGSIYPNQAYEERSLKRRIPRISVPPMPAHFMPRAELLARVRDALLERNTMETARTIGLVGMPGSGKSVLARALGRDEQVRRTFPNGIVWLELGPAPNLVARQAQLAETIADSPPAVDVQQGLARLNRLLAGGAYLVILDNVWERQHLQAFVIHEPRCAVLVTTRNQDVFDRLATIRSVSVLSKKQARQLLAAWADQELITLPAESIEVARECGGLPLALAIAGGMVADGHTWGYVSERLRRADLDKLEIKLPDYWQYADLLRVLDASVSGLPDQQRDRYLELAAFDGHGHVPVEVVYGLWQQAGLARLESEYLVLRLARRSLLQHDRRSNTLTLHDLQFDYARHQMGIQRMQALHARLATAFLATWGGLKQGLTTLWESPLADTAERYGVLNLVSHMRSANQENDIHRLLTLSSPAGTIPDRPTLAENLWYAMHDRIGETAPYLGDVDVAWSLAKASTDRASVTEELGRSIGLEVRYALITASVASIAASIPSELLVALVQNRHWTAKQGLTYARQIPSAEVRARTLASLLAILDDQTADIPRGLGTKVDSVNAPDAGLDTDYFDSTEADLPEIAAEALAAAYGIDESSSRASILTILAPRLPESHRMAALEAALAAARAIPWGYLRAKAIVALAAHLPEDLQHQALAAVLTTNLPDERAAALIALAPHLTNPDCTTALNEALAAIRDIREPGKRVTTLAALAPQLSENDRATALAQALAAVPDIREPGEHAAALIALAPYLTDPDRTTALNEAWTIFRAMRLGYSRAKNLVALAAHLPKDLQHQALAAIHALPASGERAAALIALAPHLTDPDRTTALNEAWTTIRTISDGGSRAAALTALAPQLSENDRATALAQALADARAINDARMRADTFTALVHHLPRRDRLKLLDKALADARASDDPNSRAAALTVLAPLVPELHRPAVVREALTEAYAVRDAGARAAALTALAPHLPEPVRRSVIGEALAAGRTIHDSILRDATLTSLMSSFPEVLGFQALATARAIDKGLLRSATLAGTLKSCLPEEDERLALLHKILPAYVWEEAEPRNMVADALSSFQLSAHESREVSNGARAVTQAIEEIHSHSTILATLASSIPPRTESRKEPMVFDRAITEVRSRLDALNSLALELPEPLQDKALAAAQAIQEAGSRADADTMEPGSRAPDYLQDFLSSLDAQTEDPASRAAALTALIPELSEADRPAALAEALAAARTINETSRRAPTVEMIAQSSLNSAMMPWEPHWRALIDDAATRGRAALLSDLSAIGAVILRLGGKLALRECIRAILDIGRWWP